MGNGIIFGQLPEGAATSRRCCTAAPKIRGIISQMLRIRSMYVKRRRRLTLRAALNFACDQSGNRRDERSSRSRCAATR